MSICRICRFATELDDVVLRGPGSGCICLRCFGRTTGSARPMARALRRELQATLATLEPA